MVQTVIYPHKDNFNGKFAINTIRAHLCGFYEELTKCLDSGAHTDPQTGHRVCSGCDRITVDSGLRTCDICYVEYIDKIKLHSLDSDTNCPRCIEKYGIDE